MSNLQISWYRLGVRLTQLRRLLSACDGVTPEIPAALFRLSSSLTIDTQHAQLSTDLTEAAAFIRAWSAAWLRAADANGRQSVGAEVTAWLAGLTSSVLGHLEGESSSIERLSIELGLEIADGLDSTWSDGRPHMEIPNYPRHVPTEARLPYPRLTMIDPRPPRWQWRNEQSIHECAAQLEVSLTVLFPDVDRNRDPIDGLFGHLPFRQYWGWHSIEAALSHLSQGEVRPRWHERALWIGAVRVRQIRNPAKNQVALLDAFQSEGWPSSVANPFADPRTLTQTIDDLNSKVNPRLIHFFADGRVRASWQLLEAPRPSAAP